MTLTIQIFTPIEDSKFNQTRFTDLAPALKELARPTMEFFSKKHILWVNDVEEKNVLANASVWTGLGEQIRLERLLAKDRSTKKLLFTLELLAWYFGPKFRSLSPRGTIHGQRSCTTCGTTVKSGIMKCQNWQCESHKKWKLIDPTYRAPKQPLAEKQYLQDMKRTGRAFRSVPDARKVTLHNDRSITVESRDGSKKKIHAPRQKQSPKK